MLSDGNKTDGNTLERFLTPYQNSRLSLNSFTFQDFATDLGMAMTVK